MAWILNIETTTTNCSVSLGKDGKLVAMREDNDLKYSHSEYLHLFIQELLKEASLGKSDLKAIAISEGPGSYTGLRIGLSAAKGLCYSLDIPLISVSTLESLANKLKIDEGYIIPLLDARRMEVYSAIFDHNFKMVRGVEAEILDGTLYQKYLDRKKVYFIGNAVEKTRSIIKHPNAVFSDMVLPSSKEMALLSYNKYQGNHFEDVAYFEPNYLKEFAVKKAKL